MRLFMFGGSSLRLQQKEQQQPLFCRDAAGIRGGNVKMRWNSSSRKRSSAPEDGPEIQRC